MSFVPRMIVCRVVTYLHKLPRCTPLGMRTCSPWVPHSVRRSFYRYRDYWRKDPATTNTHNSRQSGPWSQIMKVFSEGESGERWAGIRNFEEISEVGLMSRWSCHESDSQPVSPDCRGEYRQVFWLSRVGPTRPVRFLVS